MVPMGMPEIVEGAEDDGIDDSDVEGVEHKVTEVIESQGSQ
jgi:hypothetical protein